MWGLRVSLPRSSNAPSYPIVQAELDHLSTQHLRIVSLETSPVDDPQKIHHMTSSWFHIRCLVVIQFKDVQNKQSALNTPDFKRPQDAATIWLPCLVRKPQGSQAAGWPQNDQCHGENDDQPWHFGVHQEKSDSISETPDLFQFVVPTKAATNKQHNSTRWWFSVLSWFPHQLYIYDKPYGISYTNCKFASSLNFKSLDFKTMPCLLAHQPGCLYVQSHLLWF